MLLFAPVIDFRKCKPTVGAENEFCLWECALEVIDSSKYDPEGFLPGMSVGWAKYCTHKMLLLFVIDRDAYNKWEIAIAVIAGLEKCQLLVSMGGIIGDITVNDYSSYGFPCLALYEQYQELFPHPVKLTRGYGVFKTRECGLTAQVTVTFWFLPYGNF